MRDDVALAEFFDAVAFKVNKSVVVDDGDGDAGDLPEFEGFLDEKINLLLRRLLGEELSRTEEKEEERYNVDA